MRKKRITISVYLTTFVGMFLITSRTIILPTILKELNSSQYYNLAVILNSFAMCLVIPIAGKISDIYGRKKIYITGAAGYSLACTLCVISKNIYFFLLGMFFIGVFFGLMNSVQLAVIIETYDKKEQLGKISNINIANSLACISAPILAGYFTDYISWRLTFIMAIPFGIYIFITLFKYLPDDNNLSSQTKKIDSNGAFWFVLTFIPVLLLSDTNAGIYKSSGTLVILIIIVFIFGIFLYKTEKRAKYPIIPYRLFKYKSYLLCAITYLICSIGFSAANYLPVYYQEVKGLSALICGVLILPRQISQILLGIILKKGINKIDNAVGIILGFLILYCSTFVVMSQFSRGTVLLFIIVAEILFGISNSGITILSQSFCSKQLPFEEIGGATGFIGFIGAFGYTVGSSIGGIILNTKQQLINRIKLIFISFSLFMVVGCIICLYYILKESKEKSCANTK